MNIAILTFSMGLISGTIITICIMAILTINKDFEEEIRFNKQECNYTSCNKCASIEGVIIKPDGIHELDPCIYEEIETHYGCMVKVLKCEKCGNIEVEWFKSDEEE